MSTHTALMDILYLELITGLIYNGNGMMEMDKERLQPLGWRKGCVLRALS